MTTSNSLWNAIVLFFIEGFLLCSFLATFDYAPEADAGNRQNSYSPHLNGKPSSLPVTYTRKSYDLGLSRWGPPTAFYPYSSSSFVSLFPFPSFFLIFLLLPGSTWHLCWLVGGSRTFVIKHDLSLIFLNNTGLVTWCCKYTIIRVSVETPTVIKREMKIKDTRTTLKTSVSRKLVEPDILIRRLE